MLERIWGAQERNWRIQHSWHWVEGCRGSCCSSQLHGGITLTVEKAEGQIGVGIGRGMEVVCKQGSSEAVTKSMLGFTDVEEPVSRALNVIDEVAAGVCFPPGEIAVHLHLLYSHRLHLVPLIWFNLHW